MNLTNFMEFIDSKIIERGFDYYLEGRVKSLEKVEEDHYVALIEGSEIYSVEVLFASNGEILDSYCDCPYDWSEYCKHQVAVFYTLATQGLEEKDSKFIRTKPKAAKQDLIKILASLSKDQLITIIGNMIRQYPEFEQQLYVMYGSATEEITEAKKLIREYINKAKYRGFIEWDKTAYAMKGAWIVLDKAGEKAKGHDAAGAVTLSIAVLTVVVDVIQYCDDSDGEVGSVIGASLAIIDEAIHDSLDKLDTKEQTRLFDMLMKEALNKRYEGWDEWRFALLRICGYFCGNADLRIILEKQLDKQLNSNEGNDYHRKYKECEIKLIQFAIINKYDGQEMADRFIQANLKYSEFRQLAIENALKVKDYKKVLQLCFEGEELDKGYAGLISKWKKYRFAAYQAQGDINNQRKLAMEFVLQNDFEYYKYLKEMYPPNEWPQQLEYLLTMFDKQPYQGEAYVSILIEESLDVRLLEYCKRNISQIEKLFPHIVRKHFEEVKWIFVNHIKQEAERANNRSNYRKVCAIIKKYQKACGSTSALNIIKELKETYPRRAAFIDELNRFR